MPIKSVGLFGKFTSLIYTPNFFSHYDKRNESDGQMVTRISSKFAVLIFVIFMLDTLLHWFLIIMHHVFELIHLLIEAIEYSIELILGAAFNTNSQESDIIIVNGTIIISLYLCYRFYWAAPVLYTRLTHGFFACCMRIIGREMTCWQESTLIRKIKLVAVYSVCITFLFSLITL